MARVVSHAVGIVVVESHRALALTHRLLERGHDTLFRRGVDHHAVDHKLYVVYLVTVEFHAGGDLRDDAVDTGIYVPAFGQRLE